MVPLGWSTCIQQGALVRGYQLIPSLVTPSGGLGSYMDQTWLHVMFLKRKDEVLLTGGGSVGYHYEKWPYRELCCGKQSVYHHEGYSPLTCTSQTVWLCVSDAFTHIPYSFVLFWIILLYCWGLLSVFSRPYQAVTCISPWRFMRSDERTVVEYHVCSKHGQIVFVFALGWNAVDASGFLLLFMWTKYK